MEEKDILDEQKPNLCCMEQEGRQCGKLDVYDWLEDVVHSSPDNDMVEVRFKNTRKDYFQNSNNLSLKAGDIVAVEGNPGHDIGIVTLTGELVKNQLVKNRYRPRGEYKKIYRKAKPNDLEKWQEAINLEYETMIRSRQIVTELSLDMKIGDVEYQGDKTKAIFYYIAEGRVDFRELIKVLATTFKIRIEMKQIGARQEAGRIGGIGPCGRELCCSSWMSNFKSVSTGVARIQEVSLNPQKLAGQCGKLKCCLNYEIDTYEDARKDFPSTTIQIESKEGKFAFIKSDTFKRLMYYVCVSDKSVGGMREVPVERVKKIIAMNRKGEIPEKIIAEENTNKPTSTGFNDILTSDDDSLTRFDKPKNANSRRKNNTNRRSKSVEDDNNQKTNNRNEQQEQNNITRDKKSELENKSEDRIVRKYRPNRNNNNRRRSINRDRRTKDE